MNDAPIPWIPDADLLELVLVAAVLFGIVLSLGRLCRAWGDMLRVKDWGGHEYDFAKLNVRRATTRVIAKLLALWYAVVSLLSPPVVPPEGIPRGAWGVLFLVLVMDMDTVLDWGYIARLMRMLRAERQQGGRRHTDPPA